MGVFTAVAGQTNAESRVPVTATPEFVPDIEVKKLGGKYVLQRTQTGPRVIFASHRSHSSHSSHASHASHSSSSHYSGSHYSSSPAPSPQPTYKPPPQPTPSTTTVMHEAFDGVELTPGRWRKGLLIHQLAEYDHAISVRQSDGTLQITPRGGAPGKHFYGVVSAQTFDLTSSTIAANVLQVPSDGATAIMAVGPDMLHYAAFRVTDSQLVLEHRSGSEHSITRITFDPMRHRFWRFREVSDGVIAWETSPDGQKWHLQHATEASFSLSNVTLQLAAGSDHAVERPGSAIFAKVDVAAK
jgi:hypothetical protein